MRVLVTDGDTRAALAITRSLGRAGHHVIVGDRRDPSLAQTSRFCSGRVRYADPAREEAAFIDTLLAAVREHRVDVILPVTDVTTMLVTERCGDFERHCRVPFASAEVIACAADKVRVIETAAGLGVPVPGGVVVHDASRAHEQLESAGLAYPIVIKPHRSRVRTAEGWRSCAVKYARTPEELALDLAGRHRAELPVLLQERIVGPGVGVFVCYDRGRPVAVFSHRRLREKPPSGGISVFSESIPVAPDALEYSERLLSAIRWQGVAMVEFKRDQRDGAPKLMEINGRFWGSLQLAIDAGVDFPNILLRTLDASAPGEPPAYRTGVKNRWFWGDVDALFLQLRAAGNGRTIPGKASRVRSVLEFMKLWGKDLHYENPKLSDLKPWLYETSQWLKGAA